AAFPRIATRALRELYRAPRDVPFGGLGLARHLFHDSPASVTRFKITVRVNAGWVFTQNGLYPAYSLDDLRLLQFRELPETSDGCRYRHQVIGFFGVVAQDDGGKVRTCSRLDPLLNG